MIDEILLAKAACLRDILPLLKSADGDKAIGKDFLEPFLKDDPILLELVLRDDDNTDLPSLILSRASAIASAVDKREPIGEKQLLSSLWQRFGDSKKECQNDAYFAPHPFDGECVYPTKNPPSSCQPCLEFLQAAFLERSPSQRSLDDLLRVLALALAYLPAGTPADGLSDISLYDHAKLSQAIAVILYRYVKAKHQSDWRSFLTDEKTLQKEQVFLLVSGDLSGVQQFIYTIPSKGALKSLRGRSFYLDILLENIADALLEESGLSRAELLYTGGGHFYMLLPNTDEQKEILDKLLQGENSINRWFLKHYGNRLYLALAHTPCSAAEFMGLTELGAGAPFSRVSTLLNAAKLKRYDADALKDMFSPESNLSLQSTDGRECSICHFSSPKLKPYNDDDDALACDACRGLYRIGEKMLSSDAFLVRTTPSEDSVPLPGDLYLTAGDIADGASEDTKRIYVKNQLYVNS